MENEWQFCGSKIFNQYTSTNFASERYLAFASFSDRSISARETLIFRKDDGETRY